MNWEPGTERYYEKLTADAAAEIASQRIEEWSYVEDPHGYCHERSVLARLLTDRDRLTEQLECVCGHSLDAHDGPCQGDKIVAPGSFVRCECDAFTPPWAHWQERAEAAEAALRDLRARVGPDYHVYEQREDGWSIKHPLACRDEMLDCPVHLAARTFDQPPVEPGRYRADLNEAGLLDFAALAQPR